MTMHTVTVKPCKNSNFHGMDCLEAEGEYGFFKSDIDVRPSQCIWIRKEYAERLYELFKESSL